MSYRKISKHIFINIFLLAFSISACNSQNSNNKVAGLPAQESVIAGPNIPIISQFKNKAVVEPHIAVHPGNNNHLLVSAMVVTDSSKPYESCRLSSFVSNDGGLSWKETAHDWWGYDPWVSILADGKTTMSWIGTKGSFRDEYPVVFFNSPDGGISWNNDVQMLPGGHDGTKITGSGSNFYFTTVFFGKEMEASIRLYAGDGMKPFELLTEIDSKGERLNFCEAAVLGDSSIIIPASLWKKNAWVYRYKEGILSDAYPITDKLGGGKGYAHLVGDNTASAFKDRLYFIRAAGYGNEYDGIWLNYSADKGSGWSKDIRVDLFDNPKRSFALVPSVAINKDGVVGVSWVDNQEPGDKKNDLYFTYSTDGGASFHRPVKVTGKGSSPKTILNNDVANKFPGGGHYLGIAAKPDGSFQLVWSDSRNGVFQLQTCNVALLR
ncbi:MAG: hypothetical protein SFU87_05865 [Chitinophagaceae bacterium]|nr:hypothetical protein [Chitinophagaceae bacterium]